MRRRVVSSRVDKLKVRARHVDATPLITVEEPGEDNDDLAGAFVRLKPTAEMSEEAIEEWRLSVLKVAKAVKVVPPPKSEDVPLAAGRVEEVEEVGTIREEAIQVAKETGNKEVVKVVKSILDETGCP